MIRRWDCTKMTKSTESADFVYDLFVAEFQNRSAKVLVQQEPEH